MPFVFSPECFYVWTYPFPKDSLSLDQVMKYLVLIDIVEAYPGLCQTSKMESFAVIVNCLNLFTVISNHFIVDLCRTRGMPLYCTLTKINRFLPSVTFHLENSHLLFHFYTPLKRQKTFGFLAFSGGMKWKNKYSNWFLYETQH